MSVEQRYIRDTKVLTKSPAGSNDWSGEARASRKWGVEGVVKVVHDSHGLCYTVQHADGSIGYYNHEELVEVPVEVPKGFHVDVKRLRWPGSFEATCPKCGGKRVVNGEDRYLSYPTANEPFDFTVYCHECSTEWPVKVILHFSLEVLP